MKKNRIFNALVLAASLILLNTSCEVGLGASVDVDAPTLSITYPEQGSVIRENFIIYGECGDDKGISHINVTVNHMNGEKATVIKTFKAILDETQTTWQANINDWLGEGKGYNGWELADGNYVIDGHHRWSQVFAFNPDAKMVCCDYDGDISPIQMLKATQGAIAAVKAENDGDKIPQNKVEGQNLFDTNWNEDAVKKHVKETAVDGVVDMFKKYKKELTDIDKIADFVAENLMDLKANNYPEKDAPNRGDMPQTDKGGKNTDDKKSAMPDQEGSALNKLKDGKFDKDAVK